MLDTYDEKIFGFQYWQHYFVLINQLFTWPIEKFEVLKNQFEAVCCNILSARWKQKNTFHHRFIHKITTELSLRPDFSTVSPLDIYGYIVACLFW